MENKIFLNRYRLSRGWNGLPVELHRTPTAIMYRGQELESGREMAIELVPWKSTDPLARERLEAEATAAKQISQINVPKLYDFGIEDGQLIYVTEYFDGHTAEAWVAARGALPAAAALRVAVQIADALRAASFHHLSHHALCPANVVFVPDETALREWPAIKVLHWLGLAPDFAGAREGDARLAAAAHFASPEQLRGEKVDFPSATYSLGCTMWFLLTGARPAVSVQAKDGTTPAPADLEKLRGVPKIVRHLLGRMLRHNPAERPQDPVALSAFLQTCLARVERRGAMNRRLGLPVSSRPRLAAAGMSRRWPTRALAAAAILLLCAALAALAMPQYFHGLTSAQANTSALTHPPTGFGDSWARLTKKAPAQQPRTTSPALTANSARAELPSNQVTAGTKAGGQQQTEVMPVTNLAAVATPSSERPIAGANPAGSISREKTRDEIAAEPAPPEEGPEVVVASNSPIAGNSIPEKEAPGAPGQTTNADSIMREKTRDEIAAEPAPPKESPEVLVASNSPIPANSIPEEKAPAVPQQTINADSIAREKTRDEIAAEPAPPKEGPGVVVASNSPLPENSVPEEEVPAVPQQTETPDGSVAESSDAPSHFQSGQSAAIDDESANLPSVASDDAAAQFTAEPETEKSEPAEEVSGGKKSATQSVAAKSTSRKKRTKTPAKIAHTSTRNKHRVTHTARRAQKLPLLHVGSARADLVGTTDGKWILAVAPNRRVIVWPPPGFR